jgi:hypothetical protein
LAKRRETAVDLVALASVETLTRGDQGKHGSRGLVVFFTYPEFNELLAAIDNTGKSLPRYIRDCVLATIREEE